MREVDADGFQAAPVSGARISPPGTARRASILSDRARPLLRDCPSLSTFAGCSIAGGGLPPPPPLRRHTPHPCSHGHARRSVGPHPYAAGVRVGGGRILSVTPWEMSIPRINGLRCLVLAKFLGYKDRIVLRIMTRCNTFCVELNLPCSRIQ